MAGTAPTATLALDVQGLDALRRTVRQSPQEGLKQAARQFESLFLQMMLKSMREATPGEHVLGGSAEKFYTGMLDQQLGQGLAGRGLGLAQAMQRQLMRSVPGVEAAGNTASPAGTAPLGSDGSPRGLGSYRASPADPPPPVVGAQPPGRSPQAPPLDPVGAQPPGRPSAEAPTAYERLTAAATWSRSALAPAHVGAFMARHLPAAQRASQASGVPAPLILAQAALESGWGRREPRGEGGAPSFNLFGIKADRRWNGASVEALTTEVVDGQARHVRARFRAYGSYEEAFADHARFLRENPRYASVLQAADAQRAAQGLQRAGYATDPHYAAKLQRLMQRLS